jgi:hypothetical protein
VIGLKLLGLEHKQGLLIPLLGKAGLKKNNQKILSALSMDRGKPKGDCVKLVSH